MPADEINTIHQLTMSCKNTGIVITNKDGHIINEEVAWKMMNTI